jgi:SAM-dependent methyltransferase
MSSAYPRSPVGASDAAKGRAIDQWTADPAGAHLAADETEDTIDFYREIERTRYALYPWLRYYLTPGLWRDRRTLEVGVGLGTDHLRLYRAGAAVAGVDLTPASVEHTRRRFLLEDLTPEVSIGDAENLPFPDGSFDAVYSFGVLHHTPDMGKAVGEVHRVLRPGGVAVIGLYNRHSYFHAWRLLRHFLSGQWRQSGLDQMRSNFEHGSGFPLVTLSTRDELRELFGDFNSVEITARHLPTNRLPALFRPRVDRALRFLERRIGWYWMVVAYR